MCYRPLLFKQLRYYEFNTSIQVLRPIAFQCRSCPLLTTLWEYLRVGFCYWLPFPFCYTNTLRLHVFFFVLRAISLMRGTAWISLVDGTYLGGTFEVLGTRWHTFQGLVSLFGLRGQQTAGIHKTTTEPGSQRAPWFDRKATGFELYWMLEWKKNYNTSIQIRY